MESFDHFTCDNVRPPFDMASYFNFAPPMHFLNFEIACAVDFFANCTFFVSIPIRYRRPKTHQKLIGNKTFSTKVAKRVTLVGECDVYICRFVSCLIVFRL